MSIASTTNYIRSLLFSDSMSLVDLIVLVAVTRSFSLWIALPMYLFWSYIAEPILAKVVGADPASLAAQSKKSQD